MLILWILLFSILGSIGAIAAAAIFLSFPERVQDSLIPCLVSYASGTLLTAALLGLLAHALMSTQAVPILSTLLVGIIFFFLLEKIVLWRHCHDMECEIHSASGPMILIGDFFHNFTDGIVIAASFLFSAPLGIATGLSIIAHEIPQEVGDFAILLNCGYSRTKALILNTLSGLSTLPGAVIAYYALEIVSTAIPYVMAVSAASLLYVSLADLTPELHRKVGLWSTLRQVLLMSLGVVTIFLILQVSP